MPKPIEIKYPIDWQRLMATLFPPDADTAPVPDAPLTKEQVKAVLEYVNTTPTACRLLNIAGDLHLDPTQLREALQVMAREGLVKRLQHQWVGIRTWRNWNQERQFTEYYRA